MNVSDGTIGVHVDKSDASWRFAEYDLRSHSKSKSLVRKKR